MPISPRLETSKIEGNWRHLHDSGKSRPPISQYFSDPTGNHGSHTNLVLAMPSPMEHCRPSWTLHGLNTDFKGMLSIYHAHRKTRRVGWRFYYLLPIALPGMHKARGAIPAWNPTSNVLASSDDCMRLQKKMVQATQWLVQSIFPPQRFMLIQFVWFEFCKLDGSCLAWMRGKNFLTVLATRVVSCKCIQKESHITDCTLPNQTMKIKLLSISIRANLVEN